MTIQINLSYINKAPSKGRSKPGSTQELINTSNYDKTIKNTLEKSFIVINYLLNLCNTIQFFENRYSPISLIPS